MTTATGNALAAECDALQIEIVKWLRILIRPGQVVELRALNVPQRYGKPATCFGFYDYDHLDDMARDAVKLSDAGASGVYWMMNPVNPDLLARSANRIRVAKTGETTSDADIIRRQLLLIDADPKRPAGISATDSEKEHARRVIVDVGAYLFDAGWPDPIMADSGNGFHLLCRIDLPADDGGIVQRSLMALDDKFSDDHVSIDTSVFNPARICKLYGTWSRKGDSIPSRPHRLSHIVNIPEAAE